MKSAYLLELSVQPGGARRGNLFLCSTFAQLRTLLEWEFAGAPEMRAVAADYAVFYGETIGVWVVQAGHASTFVDLHPFLRARVDGSAPVLLTDKAAIEALAEGRDGFVDEAEFDIDWRGIEKALPPLTGTLVAPGESLTFTYDDDLVAETYIGLADELQWGWNDLEGGDDAPDDFPVLT